VNYSNSSKEPLTVAFFSFCPRSRLPARATVRAVDRNRRSEKKEQTGGSLDQPLAMRRGSIGWHASPVQLLLPQVLPTVRAWIARLNNLRP